LENVEMGMECRINNNRKPPAPRTSHVGPLLPQPPHQRFYDYIILFRCLTSGL
jgi:hypothetical protein